MTQVLIDRATLELVLRTLNRLRYDNDSAMAEEGFHEAAEALRAALANAEPAGWQPIETAPKDGTLILVREPRCSGLAVMYSNGWKYESGNISYLEATHWMPLPPSPGDTP